MRATSIGSLNTPSSMRRASGWRPMTELPRKASAVKPEQHGRLPLDEALVVQQQRRGAEHQHDDRP
jgi:hypothetical protein